MASGGKMMEKLSENREFAIDWRICDVHTKCGFCSCWLVSNNHFHWYQVDVMYIHILQYNRNEIKKAKSTFIEQIDTLAKITHTHTHTSRNARNQQNYDSFNHICIASIDNEFIFFPSYNCCCCCCYCEMWIRNYYQAIKILLLNYAKQMLCIIAGILK